MPTVAYFTPAWPASIAANGIATYVDRMATGIEGAGWKSVILAARLSATPCGSHLPAYAVKSASWSTRLARKLSGQNDWHRNSSRALAASFAEIVTRHRVDLIEMEESFGWAAEVARCVPVPVVVRLHGSWCVTGKASQVPDNSVFRDRVKHEGQGIINAAAVTSPSDDMLQRTREYYGFPLADAEVIPNPGGGFEFIQSQIPIPESEDKVILYVGRFELLKGGDLAVRAFAELARQNEDCKFVFIGPDNGIRQSDGTTASLPEFIEQNFPDNLKHRFHNLGQQPPDVVNAWRCRADVLIMASRYENFPMAVLEAMQAGKAIVATAVGGIPEILTHEQTGLLVNPECVPSLVLAVKRLLDDPRLAARLGQNALHAVRQRFSIATVAELSVSFYTRVLQNWKALGG